MRILITGGAGFIGSYLAREMVRQGHYVEIVDNFSTGQLANIPNTLKGIWVGNVQTHIHKCLPADVIFHFAATARIGKSLMDPEDTINNNVTATTAVMNFVRHKSPGAKIIHATTSNLLFTESPNNPYAASKLACENLLDMYKRIYGIKYCNVRFFNIFGDGEADVGDFTTVIENFKKRYLKDTPLVIFGDGSQTRAFTHIDDAVDALSIIAEQEMVGQTYNVGNTESWSVRDLALAFDHPIVYENERWFDVPFTKNEENNVPGWKASLSPIQHIHNWVRKNAKPQIDNPS